MEQVRSVGVSSRSSSTIKPMISFGSGGAVGPGTLALRSDRVRNLEKNHTDSSRCPSLKAPLRVEVHGQARFSGNGGLAWLPRFSHDFNISLRECCVALLAN